MTVCQDCGDEFESMVIPLDGSSALDRAYCDECVERRQQERAPEPDPDIPLGDLLDRAGVPRRQILEPVDPIETVREFVTRDWPHPDCGLMYFGETGTGKTSQMVAGLRCYVDRHRQAMVRFVEMRDLMQTLKPYGDGIEKYAEADLLALDEMGREQHSDFTEKHVHAIISERHNRCLPTLMTSNVPPTPNGNYTESLAHHESYDDRVIRRIIDMCDGGRQISRLSLED